MDPQPQPAQPPQIHARLAAVLAEVGTITKARVNTTQNFKFRGVDDVFNELHDHFAKQQIYVRPELLEFHQQDRQTRSGGAQLHTTVKMRYHFTASDGSSVAMEVPGEAADSGDKGLGKACQYAYKLLLLQMFLIPTEDGPGDPDASGTEWATPPAPQAQARHAVQRGRRQDAAPPQPPAEPAQLPPKSWRERVEETPPGQALRELTTQILKSGLSQDKKEALLRTIAQKEGSAGAVRAEGQGGQPA